MPVFLLALWGAVLPMLGTMVGRVLLSLGIGYLTFTGVDTSISWAKAQFLAGFTGVPAAVVGLATVMQIGTCVSMLLSAVTARLVIAGLTSGTMKKMVIK